MGSGGAAPQRVLASGRRTRPRPHTARLFGGSSPTCTGRAARFKRSKRVAHARPRNSFVRDAAGIGLRRCGGRVLRLTRARGLRPFPAKLLWAGYLMLWRVRCTTESQLTPDELRPHGTNDLTADHDVLAHLERLLAAEAAGRDERVAPTKLVHVRRPRVLSTEVAPPTLRRLANSLRRGQRSKQRRANVGANAVWWTPLA